MDYKSLLLYSSENENVDFGTRAQHKDTEREREREREKGGDTHKP